MSLESDKSRNILEDESANSGVDGKTARNKKDGCTDVSTTEMRHVQPEPISTEIDKHDVVINIPGHRKSYADIVKTGISGEAKLGPPDQMSGET